LSVQSRIKQGMKQVINECLGFTHIWNLLKTHRPKIIGHNCMLDCLYMFSHFDEPLPESFR